HLLPHTRPNLCLEIQNCPESEIAALPALEVLRVLDPPAPPKHIHARVDILVEMEALLRLGDTTARVHVQRVEEIEVAVV
ncbi:hypothetical protein B0H14DRAFT_2397541, partial [Mycena olivaceomarginata]